MTARWRRWCNSCWAQNDIPGFSCACAQPVYVGSRERAAAAIAAAPDRTNAAIAAELQVGRWSVDLARKTAAKGSGSRVGRDGRVYSAVVGRRTGIPPEKAAALRDSGLSRSQIAAELGVSLRYTDLLLHRADLNRTEALLGAEQQRVDRAVARATAALEATFEARVLEECKRRIESLSLPLYRKEQAEARAIIKARKGVMPLATFTKISSLLHPDRIQDEALKAAYAQAFDLFRSLKTVLVKEAEHPATLAPDVPRSYADLMERKRQVDAARRKNKGGSHDVATR